MVAATASSRRSRRADCRGCPVRTTPESHTGRSTGTYPGCPVTPCRCRPPPPPAWSRGRRQRSSPVSTTSPLPCRRSSSSAPPGSSLTIPHCTAAVHSQNTVSLAPDLQNVLRQSYDNAEVTIDFRQTSQVTKHLTKDARLFSDTVHLQNRKIV